VVWGGTSPAEHTHRHQTAVFRSGETCPEAGSKRALPSEKLPPPQNRLPVNNVRGPTGPYTQHKRDGVPLRNETKAVAMAMTKAWSLRKKQPRMVRTFLKVHTRPPHRRLLGPLGKGGALCNRRSTAVLVGPPRPSSITHPDVAPATVTCSYIVGTGGFLAGATRYTTGRRSVPPWGTMGRVGFDSRNFFPDGRSPVSHTTCEVHFPPRRSGEYRKGMIPARPLYQGGWGGIGLGSRTLKRAGR
jgi:hypothetical protein